MVDHDEFPVVVNSWVRQQSGSSTIGFFETRFGHFRGRILNEFDLLIGRKLRGGCFFASAASNVVLIENVGVKIEKNLNLEI